ncbi:prepilin peptidase [Campylobacter porcelli]|uniref:Peptidase A24 N-terminal domain protein, putative prepilin signal peptidase n=1 Tax=Campylobacter porcelli TaxID=1660073 RepID=A0A1X9SWY5_9BACT|nr:A24 family peptidase [Campylobacter sp. RM6137]ARR00788.1 peptidase A24 N-terminal domain protein, putative prepilin signal peptidase [Campylobacter sp. RM6137]
MLFIFFIFGLCLGSFAMVLIERLPNSQDIIFTRSRCPKCHKKLNFYELIPLISYLALKRECKSCKFQIPAIYPISELLIGILAILAYFIQPNLILAVILVIIFTIFYALSVIDFRLKAVPNSLLMSGYFLAIIYAFMSQIDNALNSLIIIGFMVILKSTLMLLRKNAIEPMGDADSIFIGSMVAILGLKWGFIALFIGAIIQLIIHLIKKSSQIAFIPALFASFIIVLISKFNNINLGLI